MVGSEIKAVERVRARRRAVERLVELMRQRRAVGADVVMRPENRVAVSNEVAETLRDLIDWLEDLDDVQDVYHNAALPNA